eukprot:TRINITY_DN1155_c0_g2_i5.p1 TRINITY_DN1155_c0_g2~~TRINITY_DN1155_c0_g2_i5.p1  ORF type:complete len:661 (-),score=156.59 TRINITY_DN1155_c0_g2_i5:732-2714(-)
MGSVMMSLERVFRAMGKTVNLEGDLRGSNKDDKKAKAEVQGRIIVSCDFQEDPWQQLLPMTKKRMGHTVSLLSNRRVLVVGGCEKKYGVGTGSCEVINIDRGGSREIVLLRYARTYHCATTLKNGFILITGGVPQELANEPGLKHCEIFNGTTFEDVAPMKYGRFRHSAVLLQDGSVLVTGGLSEEIPIVQCEIYDPRSNKWYEVTPIGRAVFGHEMVVLQNGFVLLIGGGSSKTPGEVIINSLLYNPALDVWSLGPSLPQPYFRHHLLLMKDGTVLIMPGSDWWASHTPNKSQRFNTQVLYYDPELLQLFPLGNVRCSCGHAARLRGDIVIYFGGFNTAKGSTIITNYFEWEKYHPKTSSENFNGAWYTLENMLEPISDASITVLDSGRQVVICGGLSENNNDATDSVFYFNYNCTKNGRMNAPPETDDMPVISTPLRAKVIPLAIKAEKNISRLERHLLVKQNDKGKEIEKSSHGSSHPTYNDGVSDSIDGGDCEEEDDNDDDEFEGDEGGEDGDEGKTGKSTEEGEQQKLLQLQQSQEDAEDLAKQAKMAAEVVKQRELLIEAEALQESLLKPQPLLGAGLIAQATADGFVGSNFAGVVGMCLSPLFLLSCSLLTWSGNYRGSFIIIVVAVVVVIVVIATTTLIITCHHHPQLELLL